MPTQTKPEHVSANYVAQQVTLALDKIWNNLDYKSRASWNPLAKRWKITPYKAYIKQNFKLILNDQQPVRTP